MGKLLKSMNFTEQQEKEIHIVGKDIIIRLNTHHKQWLTGLPFSVVISKYGKLARKLEIGIDTLVQILIDEKYLKVLSTPNGLRMAFSGDCELTQDEMEESLRDYMFQKESEKEQRKLERRG